MTKKFLVSLAIVFLMFGMAEATPIWHTYNGHEYALTETHSDWTTAKNLASSYYAT